MARIDDINVLLGLQTLILGTSSVVPQQLHPKLTNSRRANQGHLRPQILLRLYFLRHHLSFRQRRHRHSSHRVHRPGHRVHIPCVLYEMEAAGRGRGSGINTAGNGDAVSEVSGAGERDHGDDGRGLGI